MAKTTLIGKKARIRHYQQRHVTRSSSSLQRNNTQNTLLCRQRKMYNQILKDDAEIGDIEDKKVVKA